MLVGIDEEDGCPEDAAVGLMLASTVSSTSATEIANILLYAPPGEEALRVAVLPASWPYEGQQVIDIVNEIVAESLHSYRETDAA